jgi:hypothetical protein
MGRRPTDPVVTYGLRDATTFGLWCSLARVLGWDSSGTDTGVVIYRHMSSTSANLTIAIAGDTVLVAAGEPKTASGGGPHSWSPTPIP